LPGCSRRNRELGWVFQLQSSTFQKVLSHQAQLRPVSARSTDPWRELKDTEDHSQTIPVVDAAGFEWPHMVLPAQRLLPDSQVPELLPETLLPGPCPLLGPLNEV